MLYSFDGKQPVIGKESYVSETAILVGGIVIGDNCYIGHGAILRADYGNIEIGNGTAIEEGVVIHSPPDETCHIGNRVTIGHGAVVHSAKIADNVTIGMGAILSIRSEIGENTIVAEGTVVKMNQIIPPDVLAAGNPARVKREVGSENSKFWEWGKQLYIDLAKKYLKSGMKRID
jgi:carbonic anhydrase/acetyltransferase-like protein (isoleucine patch superfamily)